MRITHQYAEVLDGLRAVTPTDQGLTSPVAYDHMPVINRLNDFMTQVCVQTGHTAMPLMPTPSGTSSVSQLGKSQSRGSMAQSRGRLLAAASFLPFKNADKQWYRHRRRHAVSVLARS